MASKEDFEALTKLRADIANDIEMRRYQLEGIDLAVEALKSVAKAVAPNKAAGATKPPAQPKDKADSNSGAEQQPEGEPAAPTRARLSDSASAGTH